MRVDHLVVMRPRRVGFENRGYRLAAKGDRSFSTQDRLLEVHHLVVNRPRRVRFENRGWRLAAKGRLGAA